MMRLLVSACLAGSDFVIWMPVVEGHVTDIFNMAGVPQTISCLSYIPLLVIPRHFHASIPPFSLL